MPHKRLPRIVRKPMTELQLARRAAQLLRAIAMQLHAFRGCNEREPDPCRDVWVCFTTSGFCRHNFILVCRVASSCPEWKNTWIVMRFYADKVIVSWYRSSRQLNRYWADWRTCGIDWLTTNSTDRFVIVAGVCFLWRSFKYNIFTHFLLCVGRW